MTQKRKQKWSVPQSRAGRRPMRISTLLKKEKDGSLIKRSGPEERLARLRARRGENPDGSLKYAAGKAETYVPWYGTALGGVGGAMLGKKLLLKKLQAVGALGGTLLGTAVGLHGGEAAGRAIDRKLKTAGKYGKNSAGFDLQGREKFQGLTVDIENRKGSVRKGTNDDGTEWKTKFKVPYGYIKGTKGADGDEIDAYVGPDKEAPNAHIVRQKKEDGSFDEDTVMLGFKNKSTAKKAILQHYDDPKYVGKVDTVPMERLKKMVDKKGKLKAASVALSSTPSPGLPLVQHSVGAPGTKAESPARGKRKPGDVPDMHGSPDVARAEVRHNITGIQLTTGTAADHEAKLAGYDPSMYASIKMAAFFNEMDEMEKEAFRAAVKQLMGRVRRPVEMGGGLRGMKPSLGYGKSLAEGGTLLQGAKKVPGLSAADMSQVQKFRPTSAGRRIAGEAVHGAGHHIDHASTLKMVTNPLGVPLGGALEGATRGVGKELQRAGSSGVQRAGQAMVKHAPKAGVVGEVGALGGLGAAVHAPLSGAAVIGGKLAPVLGHAGALGHIAQDALGTAVQGSSKHVHRGLRKAHSVVRGGLRGRPVVA